MATNLDLLELDSVEILVIVDNELDPISKSPNPAVEQTGGLQTIGIHGPDISQEPGRGKAGSWREMRMDQICCGAHGLSLMITGVRDSKRRTLLFDTGPEEHVWERNAKRLGADIGKIEIVQLSHWHRDHSGGMLKAVSMINSSKSKSPSEHDTPSSKPVHVDLHPSRPDFRGFKPPDIPVFSLEADPSFQEIEQLGGVVDKNDQPHTVCDGMFVVSGEIPRVTDYEKGLRFGVRFDASKGGWEQDEKMADERFLMCKIKGTKSSSFTFSPTMTSYAGTAS